MRHSDADVGEETHVASLAERALATRQAMASRDSQPWSSDHLAHGAPGAPVPRRLRCPSPLNRSRSVTSRPALSLGPGEPGVMQQSQLQRNGGRWIGHARDALSGRDCKTMAVP